MMRFELGLEEPDPKRALTSALTIAGAYIVGGMIPLSPYILIATAHSALLLSVAVTLTAKARRLLPALDEQGRALEGEISTPLSSQERNTLRHLLQRIAAGAGLIPGVHPELA